jgi:hypothetical protein
MTDFKPDDIVECIDNSGPVAGQFLVMGQHYQVRLMLPPNYTRMGRPAGVFLLGLSQEFRAERFKLIDARPGLTGLGYNAKHVLPNPPPAAPGLEASELAFFARCNSDNACTKCGAPTPCGYHPPGGEARG